MRRIVLKKRIMMQVYAIYLWRQVVSVLGLKMVSFFACLAVVVSSVSTSQIVANMPSFWNAKAMFIFSTNAFQHTEKAVQLFSTAFLLVFFILCIDFYKNYKKGTIMFMR